MTDPRLRVSALSLGGAVLLLTACGSTSLPDPASPEGSSSGPSGAPTSTPTSTGTGTPAPSPVPDAGPKPDASPPVPVLRFAALGDVGKGNANQQKVADALAAKCTLSGCDFVQLLGDNIYESGADSVNDPLFQSRFEQPYAKVNAPFWVVLGNHDYGGNGAGTSFDKGQNEVDYTAKSMKWKLPSNFWHRTQNDVELIGLDTNLILFGRDQDQKTQVPQWIAAATSTWKIALGHHPVLSNGPHGNAGRYEGIPSIPFVSGGNVKSFMDANICGKVDLYISGHDHSSQWLEDKCKGTELIVAGAGADSTELDSKNKTFFQTNTVSFLYVVVEGKRLSAEFIDETGKVLYARAIQKP